MADGDKPFNEALQLPILFGLGLANSDCIWGVVEYCTSLDPVGANGRPNVGWWCE